MKFVITTLLAITTACCLALDITTLDGKTYTNVQVSRVEPDGLTIKHTDGIAKLRFTSLPEAIRRQYGYDPAKTRADQQANQRAATTAAEASRLAQQEAAYPGTTAGVNYQFANDWEKHRLKGRVKRVFQIQWRTRHGLMRDLGKGFPEGNEGRE